MSGIPKESNRLLDCKCGRMPKIWTIDTGKVTSFKGVDRWVRKYRVECECGRETKEYKSKRKAIEVWNRSMKHEGNT